MNIYCLKLSGVFQVNIVQFLNNKRYMLQNACVGREGKGGGDLDFTVASVGHGQ